MNVIIPPTNPQHHHVYMRIWWWCRMNFFRMANCLWCSHHDNIPCLCGSIRRFWWSESEKLNQTILMERRPFWRLFLTQCLNIFQRDFHKFACVINFIDHPGEGGREKIALPRLAVLLRGPPSSHLSQNGRHALAHTESVGRPISNELTLNYICQAFRP